MKVSGQAAWHRRGYWAGAAVALALTLAVAPSAARAACLGDCNNDGDVVVSELVSVTTIGLGQAAVSTCPNADPDKTGDVGIVEIVGSLDHALKDDCPAVEAKCGNGAVETGEECDPGGVCIGGPNAGDPCMAESDCQGQGVCPIGDNAFGACDTNDDCPDKLTGSSSGPCVHCRVFGNRRIPDSTDTCASNCTKETDVVFPYVPGRKGTLARPSIIKGTSGAVVNGDPLVIPLPLTGQQTLTIGKERNGTIPLIIKTDAIQLPRIPVGTATTSIACACVRGVAEKRCGGVVFLKDSKFCNGGTNVNAPCTEDIQCPGDITQGNPAVCSRNSPLCTEGFADAVATCPADKKCAFILGEGNSGAGLVNCEGGPGIPGIDFTISQDGGGENGTPGIVMLNRDENSVGGPNSAFIVATTAIAQITPTCQGTAAAYGADHEFCKDPLTGIDDDPPSGRGNLPPPAPSTTGKATALITNFNKSDGETNGPFCIFGDPKDYNNPQIDCNSPSSQEGPLKCSDLTKSPPMVTPGAGVATAFTQLGASMVGDIVITNAFYAAAPQ